MQSAHQEITDACRILERLEDIQRHDPCRRTVKCNETVVPETNRLQLLDFLMEATVRGEPPGASSRGGTHGRQAAPP